MIWFGAGKELVEGNNEGLGSNCEEMEWEEIGKELGIIWVGAGKELVERKNYGLGSN